MQETHVFRQELFLLLVGDRQIHHLLHRFPDNHPIATGQRDVSVGQLFDISNQVGVENDWRPIKLGQANQFTDS